MTRILIVDDEGNIRRLVASLLEAEGYTTTEAETGEEGLSKMAADEPDAVLLDLALPGASGLEVLERIAENWPDDFDIRSSSSFQRRNRPCIQ